MRLPLKTFSFFAILVAVSCGTAKKVTVAQPSSLSVTLDAKGFMVNGSYIDADWSLKSFEASMGTCERVSGTAKSGNVVHIYDKFGMTMFESPAGKKPSGIVKEVMFFFNKGDDGFDQPNGSFTSDLKIGNGKVEANTTPSKLKTQFYNWKHCDAATMGHWYEFWNDTMFIYVSFNDDETQIQWIDVGLMKGHSTC